MSNTQLWLSIGIPTVAVLVGILLNQLGLGRLENRMTSIESRIDSHLSTIDGDLRRFYQSLGQHDQAIDIMKKKLDL